MPLYRLIEAHVLAAERLHGDDTTVPILAKGRTVTGRIWTYVRDDRPFRRARTARRALLCLARSPGRASGAAPDKLTGILQADAYGGFNALYDPGRLPKPITPALCWSHARRQFFELADIARNARHGRSAAATSPIALEAVRRIDALFDIEREINGVPAAERLAVRKDRSAPLLAELEAWLRAQRGRLSRSSAVIRPIDYLLKRWGDFARFSEDGRICLTNNAAERALRGLALGRKAWLFAGSDPARPSRPLRRLGALARRRAHVLPAASGCRLTGSGHKALRPAQRLAGACRCVFAILDLPFQFPAGKPALQPMVYRDRHRINFTWVGAG